MSRKRFPRSRGSVGNEPPAYLRDTFFSVRAARLGISLISCAVSRVQGVQGTREEGRGWVGKIGKSFVEMCTFFVSLTDGMEERERGSIIITYELYPSYIRETKFFSLFQNVEKIHRHIFITLYVFVIYITKMKLETRFYFSFQLL